MANSWKCSVTCWSLLKHSMNHLSVAVQVMQARDLVTAGHVNGLIHDLHAERLKQPRRDALPSQLPKIALHAATIQTSPFHVQMAARCHAEEIEAAEAHPRMPRHLRVRRRGESIDGEGLRRVARFATRGDRLDSIVPGRLWSALKDPQELPLLPEPLAGRPRGHHEVYPHGWLPRGS